ncbi:hypothetical protein AAFC00_007043 [Neodothiora populina]|uniref:Putative zinc-finger domain-containing protein n=1 Tax=Neodothiora populina TaxID=2781224 RepID=A0ABR3PC09_9PEZI
MAHDNASGPTPPAYYNPYPVWPPPLPTQATAPPAYPPPLPQLPTTPHAVQPPPMQNVSLPPELQGLNLTPQQLAALFSHFQSQTASLPLPPPPPPPPPPPQAFTLPQPGTLVAGAYHAPTVPVPIPRAQPAEVPLQGQGHMASPDREEGELSDFGDRSARLRSSLATRKRKISPPQKEERLVSQRQSSYNSAFTNGHGHPRPEAPSAARSLQDVSLTDSQDTRQKKGPALAFVSILNQQGFTFEDLVREGLDPDLLRNTYEELGIPVAAVTQAVPTLPPSVEEVAPGVTTTENDNAPIPRPSNDRSSPARLSVPVAPKAPAPAPLDRQSYLARLQAAKNKKSAASSSPKHSVSGSAPGHSLAPTPAVAGAGAAPHLSSAKAPSNPMASGAVQLQSSTTLPRRAAPGKDQTNNKTSDAATELVRKKMEALKAMKRRMAPKPSTDSTTPVDTPSSQPASTIITPLPTDSDHIEPPQKSVADQRPVNSGAPNSASAIPGLTSFGIPGLFMSSSGPTSNAVPSTAENKNSEAPPTLQQTTEPQALSLNPTQSSPAVSKLRKRPNASELIEAQTPSTTPFYKRPFGRSRRNSSDDAMIIEVSDDEGGAGDDDGKVNEAGQPTSMSHEANSTRQKSIRDLPPLRDFPHRTMPTKTGHFQGAPTPVGTPGSVNDAEELKRKEQEINALQVRIQEYERRKKALKAKTQFDQSRPESPAIQPTPSHVRSPVALLQDGRIPGIQSTSISGTGLITAASSPDPHSNLKADISASDAVLTDRRTEIARLQEQMAILQNQHDTKEHEKEDKVNLQSQEIRQDSSEDSMPSLAEGLHEPSTSHNTGGKLGESLSYTSDHAMLEDNAACAADESGQSNTPEDNDEDDNDDGSSMSESSGEDVAVRPEESSPDQQDAPSVSSSSDIEMATSETSSSDEDDDEDEDNTRSRADPTAYMQANASKEPLERDITDALASDDDQGESEMDLESSDSEDSDDDSAYEPAPAEVSAEPQAELQPDLQQQTELNTPSNNAIVARPQYSPYQSPLKMFKKYRFHPDYTKVVSGGFHSLTYSHRINPDLPLCRFEFAGGICRDQSCDGQHWRDMTLSDDQLLIQLGTGQNNPAKTREDIGRFNVGLKLIIQQIRQEATSSTETIGARIAEHRRQFLGDDTVIVSQ